ncbi:MAG TPA: cytochrome P450 [Steroidobacteraceae bacterium]|nr:cytochrome P450 [Steroidobacteraceae bacterium]
MALFEQFSKDPIAYLDASFNGADPVAISQDQVCVGDPLSARRILLHAEDLYDDTADGAGFFSEQRFGRRSQQIELRAQARALFRRHLDSNAGSTLTHAIAANVCTPSDWPDTGNWFFIRYFRPVLLHGGSDPRLFRLIDDIIRTSSLVGTPTRHPSWRRRLLTLRRTWLVAGEINSRKKAPAAQPRDLLDVIIAVAEPDQPPEELVDILIAFAKSISSTGFALAWALYLLGTEGDPGPDIPSGWIVLETLRLWPTPWLLGRFAKRDHELAGKSIKRGDTVIACPYLVNRHADYWPEATKFVPQRWEDPQSVKNPAFLTFGHGVHRCALADYAIEILSQTVEVLRSRGFRVEPKNTGRPLGPFLYPPSFTLKLRDIRELQQ